MLCLKKKMKNKLDLKILSGNNFNQAITKLDKTRVITFANTHSYFLLMDFKDLNKISYIFSDGQFLTNLHNIFFQDEKITRASFDFSSKADDLFNYAIRENKVISIIGGEAKDIVDAKKYILARHPKLKFGFCRDGFFFNESQEKEAIIAATESDIFIIGMGALKQETIAVKIKEMLPKGKLVLTCGAFISQTAKRGDYYIPIVKRLGLMWLQRAVLEPHTLNRLFKIPFFLLRYCVSHTRNIYDESKK